MLSRISHAKVLAILAIGAIALLLWNFFGTVQETVYYMEPDNFVYNNLQELDKASQVIVMGTVTSILPSYKVYGNAPLVSNAFSKTPDPGYLKTDVVFKITQVIKGGLKINSVIKVSHLGGSDGKNRYIVSNQPISEIGKSYLLFLSPDGVKYYIVGGLQGRYIVNKNGKIGSLTSDSGENMPLFQFMIGKDAASFAKNYAITLNSILSSSSNTNGDEQELLLPTPIIDKSNPPTP